MSNPHEQKTNLKRGTARSFHHDLGILPSHTAPLLFSCALHTGLFSGSFWCWWISMVHASPCFSMISMMVHSIHVPRSHPGSPIHIGLCCCSPSSNSLGSPRVHLEEVAVAEVAMGHLWMSLGAPLHVVGAPLHVVGAPLHVLHTGQPQVPIRPRVPIPPIHPAPLSHPPIVCPRHQAQRHHHSMGQSPRSPTASGTALSGGQRPAVPF